MQSFAKRSTRCLLRWSTNKECFARQVFGRTGIHSSLLRKFSSTGSDHSRGLTFNLKPKVCYYKALNVSTSATELEIKQAYQKLVKRLHPDINPGSEERFREVIDAYAVLSDPEKKEMYDTTIGVFDPDWGRGDQYRFWSGDHKAKMEEELSKMKGAIFHPTAEQEKYFQGQLPADKDKRLADQIKKTFDEKKLKDAKTQEDYLMVDGKKHNPDELYAYFQAKYLKNPDIETANPNDKLRFTKTIYNKVQERKAQTEANLENFSDSTGNFRVSKQAEDRITSPAGLVFKRTAPLLLLIILFGGMFAFNTQKPTNKKEMTSKHISHGEGYIGKIAPT